MTAQNLQENFAAALARIAVADMPVDEAKRHTPIHQRNPANTREQALENAATALKALWATRSNQK
jgi:hypothetical protein